MVLHILASLINGDCCRAFLYYHVDHLEHVFGHFQSELHAYIFNLNGMPKKQN